LQLQRPDFLERVQRALDASRLPPRYLELELTESMVMAHVERVIVAMRSLKALGVSLSLDDFGSGYSSLNYLRRFPIDKLKIDQSFVRDIITDPGSAGICRAVIALGHQLGMTVSAEGVETIGQAAFLRRSECDQFQGNYFCVPMPEAQTFEVLRRRYLRQDSDDELEKSHSTETLLLLDDEENVLRALVRLLRRDGYNIETATNAQQAFEILAAQPVQVIISDQRMPDISGTEFLSRVKDLYPDTVRLILSGYSDFASLTEAINRGAVYRYVAKPWDDEELRRMVREAFRIASSR
ncbi:MAG TPA: EAL domain-containing protein, partial [Tahibacter sp.]|uniref:EAL domain-containing protein n=1 Tax=Tahibacter sp. TaxID=2056211 RepID=UPI002B8E18DD